MNKRTLAEIRSLIIVRDDTMKLEEDQELIIRLASFEDATIVLELWQESARWLQSKNINQWKPENFNLEKVFKFMNNGSNVYLAELNREIVGTYLITWNDPFIWEELDNGSSGYIHKFVVNRKFKGNSIGLRLLRSAEEQIRNKGKEYIRLDCMAENQRLNQYYCDAGFNYIRRVNGEGWSANLYQKK
ncbi:GNAT family N-acetyltransferase [Paenibacillus sp. GCM10023252]|uniref:GNAT family N-acetyltransferase n=1 Tax=Paenibacillus sp. GCM10023252 TaxID=3252649 RepID=UPI0036110ACC